MGLVVIFALVTILGIFGFIRSLKDKNLLGAFFAFGTFVVFGWFAVMTVIHHGFPTAH
ncbi:DUF2759 domain-containing protein [Metabacillus litoralis]|uniref:DUF2759 domain-containing protein n=1 Tax=Metabacillus litoralis TaxID=152268 RepID=A0A5C6W936_9BACI|nr:MULTISPECIES: DUF2759 domain-containing protein [Metabacillus]MBM7604681.1 putative membrane channel-forming protein YqfA (hemolysin III family) [Metabacillus crassostreae]TXC92394.1 DUF2759 domain-containing protein [Metabacillus litoralis]